MKKILFVLIAFLGLHSCQDAFTTVLKVDPPEHVKRMAVHAFFDAAHKNLKISVGTTVGLLENTRGLDRINDAEVVITVDGENIGDFEHDPSINNPIYNYFLTLPKPLGEYGEEVEIRITHPDFETVSAKARFPEAIIPTSVKLNENAGLDENGEPSAALEFEFQDKAGVENFYELNVLGLSFFDQDSSFSTIYSQSIDPSVVMGANYDELLVNDQNFDGDKYVMRVTFGKWALDNYTSIGLKWSNLSESQYLYSRSIGAFNNSQEIGGPFAEPVSIYSNMVNGLGVLGLDRTTYLEAEK